MELWLILDTTPDASFLLLQILQPELNSSEYSHRVMVYSSENLQCLRKYDRLVVEPCHQQCLFNFRPLFINEQQFRCSFPTMYADTMFDDLDISDDDDDVSADTNASAASTKLCSTITTKDRRLIFKLPLILSLKSSAKQVILDHVCCDTSLATLQLPDYLISYLKS